MRIYFLLFISAIFVIQPLGAQIRIVDDCTPPLRDLSVLDKLAQNINDIEDKYNDCKFVPEEDRKKKNEKQASTAVVLAKMAAGCFVGQLKGFFSSLKDIITGFWDLAKLGYKLAKKFGKKMVNFLYIAYKSGITTAFSEMSRDVQSIGKTILSGLKGLPQMILEAGVKSVEGFKCMNAAARAEYVCKSISYVGTDVLIAVLTGGASKIGWVSKAQKAIGLGVRAQKAKIAARISKLDKLNDARRKVTGILDGIKAKRFLKKSLKGFDPKKAAKAIENMDEKARRYKKLLDKADDDLNVILTQLKKTPKGPAKDALKRQAKRKSEQLKKITASMNKHNTELSHLRSKKLIYDLNEQGAIEVKRVIPDGKVLNDENLKVGRYPPWSEGGPVYEIKVKKKVSLCRGGEAGEALTKGAGRWFLPCATKNFRSKAENKWVNATADNPYDEFSKYNLREGDIIQLGGINPITNKIGRKRVFVDKKYGTVSEVRGGGGEVQVFRPSRDKLNEKDLVRTVRVYDSATVRKMQADAANAATRQDLLRIKKKAEGFVDDLEAQSFVKEVQERLEGFQ